MSRLVGEAGQVRGQPRPAPVDFGSIFFIRECQDRLPELSHLVGEGSQVLRQPCKRRPAEISRLLAPQDQQITEAV